MKEFYNVNILINKQISGVVEVLAESAAQAELFAKNIIKFKASKAYKKETNA